VDEENGVEAKSTASPMEL